MNLVILGRQPKIGLAELVSMYGSNKIDHFGDHTARVDAEVNIDNLGGAIKVGQIIETKSTLWPDCPNNY